MATKKIATRKTKAPTKKIITGGKERKVGKNFLTKRARVAWSAAIAILVFFAGAYLLGSYAASGQYVKFVGIAGKCLDNDHQKKINGNKIQLWVCNSSDAQAWAVNPNGTITNKNGFCLDTQDGNVVSRTPVILQQCVADLASPAAVSQQWQVNSVDHTIVHKKSGLYLDDKYSGTADGNQVWIWGHNGTGAQSWTAVAVGGDTGGGGGSTAPPPPTTDANKTYYVDCSGGSDNNSGKSKAASWRSLAKASKANVDAGGAILLKRGC